MDEKPIFKVVKKTTYNAIINKAKLNINPENAPINNLSINKSHSFKKISNFVPILRPKKSTLVPIPLKLNKQSPIFNKKKEKDDLDKQLSDDEFILNEHSSDSDSSSISSSDMENSSMENSEKKKYKKVESRKNLDFDALNLNEIKELSENEENQNNDAKKNMKILRKKMMQIKSKAGIIKYKETEESVHDTFKNNFHIDLKNYEEEEGVPNYLHIPINKFDIFKKDKSEHKAKSIFEILSISKKTTKK